MNISKLLFVYLVFVIALFFSNGCQFNKTDNAQKDLILKIKLDKKVYLQSETVKFTLEFTNNTDKQIKLLKNAFSEVHLRQCDDSRRGMLVRNIKEKSSPAVWQILNPGETYKTMMTLRQFSPEGMIYKPFSKDGTLVKFLLEGTYYGYATYEFNKDRAEFCGIPVDKTDKSLIWFGKVTSNTIKITIKPKE